MELRTFVLVPDQTKYGCSGFQGLAFGTGGAGSPGSFGLPCFREGPQVYTRPRGPFCLVCMSTGRPSSKVCPIGGGSESGLPPFLLSPSAYEKGRPQRRRPRQKLRRSDQPCIAFATSAAKSSSAFSMPSPTSRRTKPVISAPASFAAFSTVRSGFTTKA
jgi:hypothetical protein